MARRKKKLTSGEGAEFMTRSAAMRKLQLSVKDFRKLCILKGIYPREPRNRKKAQHGDTTIKTLYAKKDIQFLLHEPIVQTLRDLRTHKNKISSAITLKDFSEFRKLTRKFPHLKLDHIIKERYPTFVSALRDLDDCLTMCFLFSTFPRIQPLLKDHPILCRRLTFEFLHAVIVGQSLRKVFVSIKGYYFQAEIKGQTITWIMPHQFGFEPAPPEEVDFNVMATFIQFYIVLLGFVNYRLFHCLNMQYPPRLGAVVRHEDSKDIVDKESYASEMIAALNIPLAKVRKNPEPAEEIEDEFDFGSGSTLEEVEKAKKESDSVKALKTLFSGLKIYINREVPRLPLVFTLKCFGGQVSWDRSISVGATFDESDESITHQIVDRPKIDKQYISRYYVQPQWVFDSVNARRLLPVDKYFWGVELPPHLSPFVEYDPEKTDDLYLPPEQKLLNQGDDTAEPGLENGGLVVPKRKKKKKKDTNILTNDNDDSSTDSKPAKKIKVAETEEELEKKQQLLKKKMAVKPGQDEVADPNLMKKEAHQEYKLREKMVPRRYKKLYSSMMKEKFNKKRDKIVLNRKRVKLEKKKKKRDSLES